MRAPRRPLSVRVRVATIGIFAAAGAHGVVGCSSADVATGGSEAALDRIPNRRAGSAFVEAGAPTPTRSWNRGCPLGGPVARVDSFFVRTRNAACPATVVTPTGEWTSKAVFPGLDVNECRFTWTGGMASTPDFPYIEALSVSNPDGQVGITPDCLSSKFMWAGERRESEFQQAAASWGTSSTTRIPPEDLSPGHQGCAACRAVVVPGGVAVVVPAEMMSERFTGVIDNAKKFTSDQDTFDVPLAADQARLVRLDPAPSDAPGTPAIIVKKGD